MPACANAGGIVPPATDHMQQLCLTKLLDPFPPIQVAELAKELQAGSGKCVLWGTAQLFKHPRYMHGAATSELPWKQGMHEVCAAQQPVACMPRPRAGRRTLPLCTEMPHVAPLVPSPPGPNATVFAHAAAQVRRRQQCMGTGRCARRLTNASGCQAHARDSLAR